MYVILPTQVSYRTLWRTSVPISTVGWDHPKGLKNVSKKFNPSSVCEQNLIIEQTPLKTNEYPLNNAGTGRLILPFPFRNGPLILGEKFVNFPVPQDLNLKAKHLDFPSEVQRFIFSMCHLRAFCLIIWCSGWITSPGGFWKGFLYVHIPRTQMTLVLIGISALLWGGLTFKNRGQLGSRYIYIYIILGKT